MTDSLKLAILCKENKLHAVVINSERWRCIRYGLPHPNVGMWFDPWDSCKFDLLYKGHSVAVKSSAIPYHAIFKPVSW